jgi:hypothetical protein
VVAWAVVAPAAVVATAVVATAVVATAAAPLVVPANQIRWSFVCPCHQYHYRQYQHALHLQHQYDHSCRCQH